jgi:hypothetical protein
VITVKILTKEPTSDEQGNPIAFACWLQLADGKQTLYLPATAPIDSDDLPAHFQTQAEKLWPIALRKGYTSALAILPERDLLKAIVQAAGLSESGIVAALEQQ